MIRLTIKKDRTGPVMGRHPWVFSGAIKDLPEGLKSGEPVGLYGEKGEFLATGYFNSYSQIAVRIWGYEEKEAVDEEFFTRRIERASALRKQYVEAEGTDSYRLINGESDFLPGLIVDKYADYLVLQCHTEGIDFHKDNIIRALLKVIKPSGIYEKSDVALREGADLSGLREGGIPDLIEIKENGLRFLVNVRGGQKTGFFLDQRDKRKALLKYSNGKSVLNCFSYTGAFSVYALSGGARKVVSVDSSPPALELARENVKLNGFDPAKCEFVLADVKNYLRENRANKFDIVVLDPPAFIKDRRKKKEGVLGYKSINEAAMGILPPDGILVSSSCSAHLSLQEFRYLISEAGGAARRSLQIVETYLHGADHPELAAFTEGQYLKCFFMRVL